MSDFIGESNVKNGYTMSIWGSSPANQCTSNEFWGCERQSQGNSGGSYLNPIISGRLRTVNSFSFKYGRVEVRAKLPKGDWIWPAIWLLPKHNAYGEWPQSGEIDIMESRGNSAGYAAGGVNTFGSTLHWGSSFADNRWYLTHKQYTHPSGDLS